GVMLGHHLGSCPHRWPSVVFLPEYSSLSGLLERGPFPAFLVVVVCFTFRCVDDHLDGLSNRLAAFIC
ncbi:MAG TPA: hypothetical protein VIY29_20265, partial [Ktedonobacteraceae bacterium]